MIFIWLIVWLISGTPPLHHWNAWVISLIVCAIISFYTISKD